MRELKRILIICDGMQDHCVAEFQGTTPFEAASTPMFDILSENGCSGLVQSVPEGMEANSDVAILNLLGRVPADHSGRAALEATGCGINLGRDHFATRCNIGITPRDGKNVNTGIYAHIISLLNRMGLPGITFHHSLGYRAIMIADRSDVDLDAIEKECNSYLKVFCDGYSGSELKKVTIKLWSPSRRATFEPLHVKGAVVAAVDLVKGIGRELGLDVIDAEGATGDCDTNLRNKALEAIKALRDHDFVLIHVEGCDEASHRCDPRQKRTMIERIDRELLLPLMSLFPEALVCVVSDHCTLSETGHHTSEPVKFMIRDPRRAEEMESKEKTYIILSGDEFINMILA